MSKKNKIVKKNDKIVKSINNNIRSSVRKLNPILKNIVGKKGSDYVIECAGTKEALNDAIMMTNRGGKICLAAFPHKPVEINIPHMVINNIYMFGIRGEGKSATHRAMQFMKEKRFNAKLVHTHTFDLSDLPTALKYARERIDDAIKIVIKPWG